MRFLVLIPDLFWLLPILAPIPPVSSHAIIPAIDSDTRPEPQLQVPFSQSVTGFSDPTSTTIANQSGLSSGLTENDERNNSSNMVVDWKKNINDFDFKSGADVLSPKEFIELPRPGAGVANPAGDLAYVSVSKYSFDDKKNNKSLWLVPITTSVDSSRALSPYEIPLNNGGGDIFWLDDRTLGQVSPSTDTKKGLELYALSISFDAQQGKLSAAQEDRVLVGTFPPGAAPTNFKYVRGSASQLVFSAYVFADENIETVADQTAEYEARGNSALVYDKTYERHWDKWTGPKKSKLFTVSLSKDENEGKWALGTEYRSILKGFNHDVPVEPFGGLEDFDVSERYIIYTAKDPQLPPAWHTRQNIYLVDLFSTSSQPPRALTSGTQGATHNPILSPDGTLAAWTELDLDGYESDRAKIVIYDLVKDVRYTLTQNWDRSADSLVFAPSSTKDSSAALYFTAADNAHVKLFKITLPSTPDPSSTTSVTSEPIALTDEHAVSAPQVLPSGDLLFTQSSLASPNDLYVFRGADAVIDSSSVGKGTIQKLTQFTEASLTGKNLDKGESVWFEGAEKGRLVQGWVIKPKGFEKGKTAAKSVPVVLLIHGGPQGAWEDGWSTRWNPNIFAQQGYFTIALNPTGSTSFGQNFTDGITKDWGGKPFVDLKKGWDYVLEKYPEIDPERAVAAGASWGGYAINWIQGHPEYGFGFKALVCHDGVFDSRYNGFTTDELFFFNHDFGGRPFDDEAKVIIERFSPSNYVHKWSTPQLIIHGSKDYRLPDTEGIGAFHALQEKGIPSRLVVFPDENHWVLNHGNSLKWHYEVFRWFDKFVGPNSKSDRN